MNTTMTKNATYIINDVPYTVYLRDVQFREFKATHTNLKSRELRIEFLKEEISNQIQDIEMDAHAEQNLQYLINRLEMLDLMVNAGVDIADIEYMVNDLITTEEVDYYKNFKVQEVGFFKELNLRR